MILIQIANKISEICILVYHPVLPQPQLPWNFFLLKVTSTLFHTEDSATYESRHKTTSSKFDSFSCKLQGTIFAIIVNI